MHGWPTILDTALTAVGGGTDRAPAPTLPWSDSRAFTPGSEVGPQDPMIRDFGLSRILSSNPGLRVEAILADAVAAFLAIEGAWSTLDAQGSRAHMAPALWQAHRSRMELYVTHGRRNMLDGLSVRNARIVAADPGPPVRVTVRIQAHSTDYDVDAQGRIIRGNRDAFDWEEDWVLGRSESANPHRTCPNCGAAFDVDHDGCCTSCRSPLQSSGAWFVVAAERIEDEEARRNALLGIQRHQDPDTGVQTSRPVAMTMERAEAPEVVHDAAAIETLHASDATIEPAAVVAHAGAAFSAIRAAWASMSPEPARPYLSEGAFAELAAGIDALRAAGLRRVADVPLIEGVRIDQASDVDGLLGIRCVVTTALVDCDLDANGLVVRGMRDLIDGRCVLKLRRHAGAASRPSDVVMQRCDRCGAPLTATVLGLCDHCRSAVAAGGGEWAIIEVGPLEPRRASASTTRTGPAPVRDLRLGLLQPLTAADPTLDAYDVIATGRDLFWRVEAALAALAPERCASVLEPALLAVLNARSAALRSAHHHYVLESLDIRSVRVVSAHRENGADAVVLRLTAEAEDVESDDLTGAVVGGSGRLHTWDEDWTLRRTGARAPWRLADISPAGGGVQAPPCVSQT